MGACLALALSWSASAQQPSAAIALEGAGPYHRLTLPLSIYGRAAHGDLRDLRVRNAAGHPVPYAWLRNEAAIPKTSSQDVPFFPLPSTDTGAADATALAFTVRPDGSVVLAAKKRPDAAEAAQWLIDLSQVKGNLLQARFKIAPEATGLFAYRLEASDDLRRWHAVGGEEQLVRLGHDKQTIERLSLDLGNLRARFLRLRWSDPQHGAPLTGIGIDSVQEIEPVAPIEWSAALKPEQCTDDHCDYRLPRGLPVQSLRINLADANTLAQIGISGLRDPAPATPNANAPVPRNPLYALRHAQRAPLAPPASPDESPLLDAVVYRLAQPGGAEARSPALALDGAVYPRLRLRTAGPVSLLGGTPPTIEVGATPRTLVFLAQGEAPFSLNWSGATVAGKVENAEPGAALALSTLVPGYAADKPVSAGEASVVLPVLASLPSPPAAPVAAQPPASATSSRKLWLWGAMGLGLLLLAGMALSLFRSLEKDKAD